MPIEGSVTRRSAMLARAKHASRIISQSSSPSPNEPSARRRSWRGLPERAGASSVQTWQRFCFSGYSGRLWLKLPGPVGVCRFRHQSLRECLAFPSSKSINEKRVQVAGKVAKSLARFIEPMECLPVPKSAGRPGLAIMLCIVWRRKLCSVTVAVSHLLAGALRARNIISSQRQTPFTPTTEDNDCRQPASDCFDECFALYSTVKQLPIGRALADLRMARTTPECNCRKSRALWDPGHLSSSLPGPGNDDLVAKGVDDIDVA
jgi:hypothetical protein